MDSPGRIVRLVSAMSSALPRLALLSSKRQPDKEIGTGEKEVISHQSSGAKPTRSMKAGSNVVRALLTSVMRMSGRLSTVNDTRWVIVPLAFAAVTEYWPACTAVTGLTVKVAEVAPERGVPLKAHW